jgi:hypothetical protein
MYHKHFSFILHKTFHFSSVLGIRIRSDPDLFAGSGAESGSEKVIFSQQHFQYFSFSPYHEKNFRTFGQNYLNQRHFELFSKSGGFYSLRSDPDPGPRSGTGSGSGSGIQIRNRIWIRFFSEVGSGSGQNGPDLPTLFFILGF